MISKEDSALAASPGGLCVCVSIEGHERALVPKYRLLGIQDIQRDKGLGQARPRTLTTDLLVIRKGPDCILGLSLDDLSHRLSQLFPPSPCSLYPDSTRKISRHSWTQVSPGKYLTPVREGCDFNLGPQVFT